MMDLPRVTDVPSGMGGISYGFQEAGFEIELGLDYSGDAVETFTKYLRAPGKVMDMRDYNPTKKDFDVIIVGGTPCQSFSLMNTNRNIYDKRAGLALEFCRIVNTVKPEVFVFENVMSIPNWVHAAVMEMPGYKVTLNKLDSVNYGVPQTRRRKIYVGTLSTHIKVSVPVNPVKKTVRDAFNGIPENWGFTNHMPHTIKKFEEFHKTSWTSNYEATFAGTIRLKWDEPSCAIVNYKKAQMLHPDEPRSISGAEALALQGFPYWFIPCGSATSQAEQIKDAVPPGLAKHVAEEIMMKVFN